MIRKLILVLILFVSAFPAPALAQEASPELRNRAEQIVAMLRGDADPAEMFTAAFLAQVPAAQLRTISGQLIAQYGAPQGVEGIDVRSATAGTLRLGMARSVLRMDIQIEPNPPHRISGLLVTGADMRGDSLGTVLTEIRALPGQTSVAVARLGDGAPTLLAAHEADRPLAIGSTFKLWILAELSRQVQAGERRWSDVVMLDRRSIPSGTLQNWPRGAPVTLHTLAALMISVSDNTATDILLRTLGRENVERMMARIGVEAAARNRPFLSTLEMAAIKTGGAEAAAAWSNADEAARRRLLETTYADLAAERIDLGFFTGNPVLIDSVEWFASANDLVRTMDWLRRNGDETAHQILSINPAVGAALRGELGYIGFKGGSEPGVINLTWLVRNREGAWHVVTGSWNNSAAPVEESRFVGLMSRAIQQLR
ncbi:MAG: serine hydrolase [Sphingosinicella sp.]|uniref:serine hydrolase n=1 Tax=Sphingosinicella sp. TaxID=1917971 RepID=UPI0040376F03